MATMRVPFLDLRVQHEPLMTELVDAFRQVTETSAFAGGPFVARFETEFAAFCGTRPLVQPDQTTVQGLFPVVTVEAPRRLAEG